MRASLRPFTGNLSDIFVYSKIESFGRLPIRLHHFPQEENNPMPHVVTDACVLCKYTDCVDVCPVDCFHEGPNFVVIDPDECIDCAICVPECPASAIFASEDVPGDMQEYIALNAELSKTWPSITRAKAALADADKWKEIKGKLKYLKK